MRAHTGSSRRTLVVMGHHQMSPPSLWRHLQAENGNSGSTAHARVPLRLVPIRHLSDAYTGDCIHWAARGLWGSLPPPDPLFSHHRPPQEEVSGLIKNHSCCRQIHRDNKLPAGVPTRTARPSALAHCLRVRSRRVLFPVPARPLHARATSTSGCAGVCALTHGVAYR